jgi:hypothetical protein
VTSSFLTPTLWNIVSLTYRGMSPLGSLGCHLKSWMNPSLCLNISILRPSKTLLMKNVINGSPIGQPWPRRCLPCFPSFDARRKVDSKFFSMWSASTSWCDMGTLYQTFLHRWNIFWLPLGAFGKAPRGTFLQRQLKFSHLDSWAW